MYSPNQVFIRVFGSTVLKLDVRHPKQLLYVKNNVNIEEHGTRMLNQTCTLTGIYPATSLVFSAS